MKTIDPKTESITCPNCSGWDVRYRRSEGQWRCKECGQEFVAKGGPNGIRIEEMKKPRRGHAEAAN